MERKEIYITGAGIVSAIGIGKAETLDALRNRRTGVAPVRYLQTTHTSLPVGEVKFANGELREMSRLMPSDAKIKKEKKKKNIENENKRKRDKRKNKKW